VTGVAARRGAGLVASALARAEEFLLDAPEESETQALAPEPALPPLVVAVVPLARGCGGTTVARGLAATLALRAAPGAALVCGPTGSVALSLGSPAAARLARAVGEQIDEAARVSGRLCLVDADPRIARAQALRREAPLVVDVSYGSDAGEATSLADAIVLVAGPETEPALAAVVGASLARSGPAPFVVVNRAEDEGPWAEHEALRLAEARLASRIALAGREPPGALGVALRDLADACAEAAT
jgi:hypothetical protein